MGYEQIVVEVEAPIATVTLNRPKVLNALSPELVAEVNRAFGELDADDDVRAVVLTGGPRVFAAGADIGDMAERTAVEQLHRDQTGRWAPSPPSPSRSSRPSTAMRSAADARSR